MEGIDVRHRCDPDQVKPVLNTRENSTQTDSRIQGHGPRLSEVNLYTLLSLWMELFPQEPSEENDHSQVHMVGLVVVRNSKVVGLHCSGPDLHAGQAAVIQHGAGLADCQLYFSRRPCSTCLKMIINAGVSLISFWPGDPEISMMSSTSTNHVNSDSLPDDITESKVDTMATEKLKSNSHSSICVLLQPLAPGLMQFVDETSRECDFMKKVIRDEPGLNTLDLFNRERTRYLSRFSRQFLFETQQQKKLLTRLGLENFCSDPYFSNLRNNMRDLVGLLATVAAGLPPQDYGFYMEQHSEPSSPAHLEGLSQEIARHCIIQARLLSYRTEDPKVGVGAVIWSKRQLADGTGRLYLLGCGYNAYPAGSQYIEYPQLGKKQEARQNRKYRYIIHAEQNALTFRTRAISPDDATMLFVTKCPCDECVPLIKEAGITHIYTTDQDQDKHKGDISYLGFRSLKVSKFIWQKSPADRSPCPPLLANGFVGKHRRQPDERESRSSKKLCSNRSHNPGSAENHK